MKRLKTTLSALAVCLISYAQHSHTPMENNMDSLSYAVGMNIAQSLKGGGIDSLNYEIFTEAVKDVMAFNHTNMGGELSNEIVNAYVAKKKKEAATIAAAAGTAFLTENAKKKGVVTLPSGLQYKILTEGTGAKPTDGQTVSAHYKGTLIDGKIFDSSYDRGQPLTIGVNSVIPGWTEALKLMPVGSKWEVYIPYNLAYGERGQGAKIPAFSTLIFTMELLEIVQ